MNLFWVILDIEGDTVMITMKYENRFEGREEVIEIHIYAMLSIHFVL